jgi:hypothetical protein
MGLASTLARKLPSGNRRALRKLRERATAWRYSADLIRLGECFRTDKWGSHWYLQHYQTHFGPLRKRSLNLLEIGVGEYSNPGEGGSSLRMWKTYFPNAKIFGLDVYDKRSLEEDRIRIFQGSQTDERFLRSMVKDSGGFDIIIDDGSHINSHVIRTFEIMFPLLRNPGIYVIEDVQTSYWPGFGGTSRHLGDTSTTMGYCASLAHCLNYEEILREDYSPSDFDRHIVGMHLYHNLIFVQKGDNREGSNMVQAGRATVPAVIDGVPYDDVQQSVVNG